MRRTLLSTLSTFALYANLIDSADPRRENDDDDLLKEEDEEERKTNKCTTIETVCLLGK